MFALARLFEDSDGVKGRERVLPYGLELPDGTAATVGADGHGFGSWTNAERAALRLDSDLVWLGGGEN
ncbi:hypothetical protein ACFYSC_01195 [Streptosporangium sp. NPDC004379]|uniref:hypothetical protein n=1 Tax=Streptosporangium sp. NPDC004379 TaxID=3366189 RepID=UPI0036B42E0F